MSGSYQSDSHLMACFITREMHRSSYVKNSRYWYPYFFQSMSASIPSDSYPWYTSSHEKCLGLPINISQHARKAWDNGAHTFSKVYLVLFHQISILWYALLPGKCIILSINFSQHVKCSKAQPMGENWNIDTHTFSRSVAILFHKISTLWYSKSRDKCSSFPMNFS